MTAFGNGQDSPIFTDVAWDQGKVWVLTAPNTSIPGATANTGRAEILLFNEFLQTPYMLVANEQRFSGGSVAVSAATTRLVLPNRFTGPVQGTTLYFNQGDYRGTTGWSHILSAFNLDTAVVKSY